MIILLKKMAKDSQGVEASGNMGPTRMKYSVTSGIWKEIRQLLQETEEHKKRYFTCVKIVKRSLAHCEGLAEASMSEGWIAFVTRFLLNPILSKSLSELTQNRVWIRCSDPMMEVDDRWSLGVTPRVTFGGQHKQTCESVPYKEKCRNLRTDES